MFSDLVAIETYRKHRVDALFYRSLAQAFDGLFTTVGRQLSVAADLAAEFGESVASSANQAKDFAVDYTTL
jgi:hypothetical protein